MTTEFVCDPRYDPVPVFDDQVVIRRDGEREWRVAGCAGR
jgi:hypothetical protein